MAKRKLLLFLIPWVFAASSCGEKPDEAKTAASEAARNTGSFQEKGQPRVVDPTQTGRLAGKVFFKGAVPPPRELPVTGNPECKIFHPGKVYSEEILVKNGHLKNVFVYVKEGLENYRFDLPQTPVKIDQVKCIYLPHVVGVEAGQPILLINSDPTLHNVHAYAQENQAWNLGMPFEGMEIQKKFSKPEVMITLKCDVHPWMTGYIGVLPHPYFAVTNEDGAFEFKNLPAGKYTLEAWHEKLGTQTQKVQIGPAEEKEIKFTFQYE